MGLAKSETTGIMPSVAAPTSNWASGIPGALKSPSTYGYGGAGYFGGKLIGGKDKTKAGYWACRAHKDFGKNVSGRFW